MVYYLLWMTLFFACFFFWVSYYAHINFLGNVILKTFQTFEKELLWRDLDNASYFLSRVTVYGRLSILFLEV